MEQKKLSQIFEEEFSKWTSLKVFWICLAIMVAGFLALCATVFYLDNGSAAKVLSGKEQLMANVWGRVFAVIAVMPVVIILFMFAHAALMGGLVVLAEKNKRKQAAKLGVAQIQEQSKDNEVAVPEQPVKVEPEESMAAEKEQQVPVAQAEESPAQPEPTVQEPAAEQAETVEREEAQEDEAPATQAEELPVQPEPTAQEPAVEQTEAAESETEPRSEEATESEVGEEDAPSETEETIETDENSGTKAKRHVVRRDSHGKPLPIIIDEKSLRAAFIPAFSAKVIDSDYSFLIENLYKRDWILTDLGKLALLIHLSKVLDNPYASMDFKYWMPEFFKMLGRPDCPDDPEPGAYKNFYQSNVPFEKSFSFLIRWYEKTQNDYIVFEDPKKKKQE